MNKEILNKKPIWYILMENALIENRKIRKHELSYEISFTKQEVFI